MITPVIIIRLAGLSILNHGCQWTTPFVSGHDGPPKTRDNDRRAQGDHATRADRFSRRPALNPHDKVNA